MEPSDQPAARDGAGIPTARVWAFRLVTAVVVPVLLLGVFEAGLRVAGVGEPMTFLEPCTVQGKPAACTNETFYWQFFPRGMTRLPKTFAIPAEKPAGTFRIFVMGESAAEGDPAPRYAFSRFLEVMLRERFPAARFEVVNTASTAINSHVLVPAARELAEQHPDLFVLYIGNNEVVGPYGPGTVLSSGVGGVPLVRASIFVNATRTGQILRRALEVVRPSKPREWGGMKMFLDRRVPADDPRLATAYASFRTNLRDIVAVARGSGARVLVSTVGTNLKDSAPFASAHRRGLGAAELASWQALYREGVAREEAGDCDAATRRYLAAASIDDRFAEVEFRLGRCAWVLGDATAAREHFVRARDLDALRFRADGRIEEIVRAVAGAAGSGVELFDGSAALAEASPGGIPGEELFWEHVHLTPHGNYVLARALWRRVVAMLPEALRRRATAADPPSEAECDRLLAITREDRRQVAAEVVGRMQRPPFTNQLDHDARLARASSELEGPAPSWGETLDAYRWAIERRPEDPWLHRRLAELLLDHEPDAAGEQFRLSQIHD
jgi:hypothetical protein